jgi:hypothetical protein
MNISESEILLLDIFEIHEANKRMKAIVINDVTCHCHDNPILIKMLKLDEKQRMRKLRDKIKRINE